jgi:hypothetical protein
MLLVQYIHRVASQSGTRTGALRRPCKTRTYPVKSVHLRLLSVPHAQAGRRVLRDAHCLAWRNQMRPQGAHSGRDVLSAEARNVPRVTAKC